MHRKQVKLDDTTESESFEEEEEQEQEIESVNKTKRGYSKETVDKHMKDQIMKLAIMHKKMKEKKAEMKKIKQAISALEVVILDYIEELELENPSFDLGNEYGKVSQSVRKSKGALTSEIILAVLKNELKSEKKAEAVYGKMNMCRVPGEKPYLKITKGKKK